MKQIAPHVYVNTECDLVTVGAILTSAGWICIDAPPRPRDVQNWLATLQEVSPAPICYLINTDAHRDRVVGNAWFKAPVVAHQVAAAQMAALCASYIAQAAEELSEDGHEMMQMASLKPVMPQISFSQTLTLYCGEHMVELVSKPSATLGNLWVLLKDEKVVFGGDAVVTGQHPYISDGASKAWLEALRLLRLSRHSDWIVVPGRGDVCSPADTASLAEYLRVVRRRIASLIRAGRQRGDVVQLIPELLDFFPYPAERREQVQRRVKVGLEAIYDEMRAAGDDSAEDV